VSNPTMIKAHHLAVLEMLPSCPPKEGPRPAEIAHNLGMAPDTIRRLLRELRAVGYAIRDEGTHGHAMTPAGRAARTPNN